MIGLTPEGTPLHLSTIIENGHVTNIIERNSLDIFHKRGSEWIKSPCKDKMAAALNEDLASVPLVNFC